VISFSKNGKLISLDLPFLQFCKKYDICTERDSVSGCAFGKLFPVPFRLQTFTFRKLKVQALYQYFLTKVTESISCVSYLKLPAK